MKSDNDLLERRVRQQTMKTRMKQKEKYQLAKRLGFSGTEAAVLQNWAEDRIIALADFRAKAT